jgi:hypothetical protein
MDQTVDVTIPVKPEVAAAFADARVEIDGLTDTAATGVVVPAAVGPARYSFWSASTVLNGDFESITGYFGFVFTSNRSQAARLPTAVAFPEGVHQVEIMPSNSSPPGSKSYRFRFEPQPISGRYELNSPSSARSAEPAIC